MEREVEQKITGNVHQGVNVRKVRQIMGLKQEVLAEKLGITQPIVSRIENRRVIEPDTLMKIANILNVPIKILQELDENPQSVTIENNTYDFENSHNYSGIIDNDNDFDDNRQIHPLDKIMELNKQTSDLYERMLTLEKEKSTLLEQLLKEKQK